MDVQKLITEENTNFRQIAEIHHKRITILYERQEFISYLPSYYSCPDQEELSDPDIQAVTYSKSLYVRYNVFSPEQGDIVRSKIQAIVNKPAIRDFNRSTGTISYSWNLENTDIYISRGHIAPGCEIRQVVKEKLEWEMICPEPNEEAQEELISNASINI